MILHGENPGHTAVNYSVTWSLENSMLLNEIKTKAMYISLTNTVTLADKIFVKDTPFETVESIKVLGVTVDKNLTFKEHIDKSVSKANSRIHGLTVFKRAGLNQGGLLRLYISNMRSVVTYGAPAWFPLLSETTRTKLEGVQRVTLKVILPEYSSYDERLDKTGLKTLLEYCDVMCKIYFHTVSKMTLNTDFI